MESLEQLRQSLKENGVSDETITRVIVEMSIHILSEYLKKQNKSKGEDRNV